MAAIADQVLFAACLLGVAFAIWHARRSAGNSGFVLWAGRLLPVVLLGGLLLLALATDRGTRLSAEANRITVPAGALPEDGEEVLLFRVADRVERGDLVVRPYLQDHLNSIALAEEPREMVNIYGRVLPQSDGAIAARVEIHDFPGDTLDERPGMLLTFGTRPPLPNTTGARGQRLNPGEQTRVRIFRDDMVGEPNQRYRERRAFSVRNTPPAGDRAGRITVLLDQPLRADAGSCQASRDVLVPSAIEGAPEPGYRSPRNLSFDALGQGGHPRAVMNGQALGPAPGRENRCQPGQEAVTWPSEDTVDQSTLQLDFKLINLPWVHLWLLFASAMATIIFGTGASRAERIVMPALLLFLSLRAMVAIAAAFYDPRVAASSWYSDAATAIIAIPPIVACLLRPADVTFRHEWLAWLLLTVLLTAASAIWLDSGGFENLQIGIIAIAAAMLVIRAVRPDMAPIATVTERLTAIGSNEKLSLRLADKARVLGTRFLPQWSTDILARLLQPIAESRALRISIMSLLVVGLGRVPLALIGSILGSAWRERIFGIPISIAVLLITFAALALGLAALNSLQKGKMVAVFWLAVGIGTACAFGPISVRDTGFALVHLIPVCGVAAWFAWHCFASLKDRIASLALLAAPAALLLALLAISTSISLSKLDDLDAPLAERIAVSLELSANDLRLVQLFEPEAVEAVGTVAAYEQMNQTAMMHSLTGSVTGRGWLHPLELLSIRREQSMDYVAAVHLMFPFGRLGAAIFLAVVGTLLAGLVLPIAEHRRPDNVVPDDSKRVLVIMGTLAAWTLFFSAAYMVLGNLLLVPFTGRNIYFLSVLSLGDMVEAVAMLAMAALALRGAYAGN